MTVRAAVVLVQDDHVCLIRRDRDGETYYLFPGGGTDPGGTPTEAAAREASEELGLHVRIDRLLARMPFDGNEQLYFHATITGGAFGAGIGEELASRPDSRAGSYTPIWVRLDDLPQHDVRPLHLAEMLTGADAWTSTKVVELAC